MQEVLSYELASVPISLAHPDGSLRKTAKNVLLSILEEDEIAEPRLPKRHGISVTHIIDGMALVQATACSGAATFGALASKYFEIVTSSLKERDCCRVDIVFDQCWPESIKNAERKKRGEGNAFEVVINSPSTPIPKQWQKMSNPRNKTNLVSFLSESWRKTAMEQLLLRKSLVIGGGFRNGKLDVSIQRGSAVFVRTLHADHKEADTRLLLHAQHAAKDGARVVIQSPDTDVVVLSVSHCEEIGCQELWFRSGVKERIRYIPVHKIAARLGRPMCKAIPAFYSLTGCDTTSSPSGIGKKNAWKVLCRNESHQESLARFGLTPNVDRSTAAQQLKQRLSFAACILPQRSLIRLRMNFVVPCFVTRNRAAGPCLQRQTVFRSTFRGVVTKHLFGGVP